MYTLNNTEKENAARKMGELIPHTTSLGVSVENVEGSSLTLKLPYAQQLVGNPETGVLHGGAITVLLDQTLGISAVCSDEFEPSITPTLDLRIDHFGIAPAGKDIYATAQVTHATSRILFMEGFAWYDSPDNIIARATGTWVRVGPIDLIWLLNEEIGGKS